MTEYYRDTDWATPGIEPGEADTQKAHETLQNKPFGDETALSVCAVSSLQKPPPSTMSGTDQGTDRPKESSALHAHVRGEPPESHECEDGNRRRQGSSLDAGHSGPPWASSAEEPALLAKGNTHAPEVQRLVAERGMSPSGWRPPVSLTGEASRPNDVSPGFSRLSSPLVPGGDERRQGQKGSSPGDSDGVERKPGQDRPSPILSSDTERCETCAGDGCYSLPDDDGGEIEYTCEECGGSGEVEVPTDTFLARSVHIAPDWRARLPAGVTVEDVEQDLAPRGAT